MSPITTAEKSNRGSVGKGFAGHVTANVVNPVVVNLVVNDVVNLSQENGKTHKHKVVNVVVNSFFFLRGKPFSWYFFLW